MQNKAVLSVLPAVLEIADLSEESSAKADCLVAIVD
jgi:hypothetical protein